jgi:hypothetical protein
VFVLCMAANTVCELQVLAKSAPSRPRPTYSISTMVRGDRDALYVFILLPSISPHHENHTAYPPEFNCLGSPAASNVPLLSTRMP